MPCLHRRSPTALPGIGPAGTAGGSIAALVATRPGQLLPDVLPWLVVLLVIVVAGAIVLAFLRRAARASDAPCTEGFTLHELRTLHARGDLTDAEFARAKAAVIARAGGAGSENPVDPPPDRDVSSAN